MDDYPDRYYRVQLRCLGYFHVVEEGLVGFRAGGISSTRDDPWVRTVIDLSFGEKELKVLFGSPHLSWLERHAVVRKFTFVALRHNIPKTVGRAWLLPVYVVASILNWMRPSPWRVIDGALQRVGS
jgi:hypothetical protein